MKKSRLSAFELVLLFYCVLVAAVVVMFALQRKAATDHVRAYDACVSAAPVGAEKDCQ